MNKSDKLMGMFAHGAAEATIKRREVMLTGMVQRDV